MYCEWDTTNATSMTPLATLIATARTWVKRIKSVSAEAKCCMLGKG